MIRKLPIFLLIIIVIAVLLAYQAFFVVYEKEKALVSRFGEIVRVVDNPGIYFKTPIIENTNFIDDRLLFFSSLDKRVQVSDGRRYLVDTVTVFKIVDARKFRETVGANFALARARLETLLDSALRSVYGSRTFEAALSEERVKMMREIRNSIHTQAQPLGIDVVDVRIRRTDLLPEVMQNTYERMIAERKAEAEQIRAVGNERQLKLRAAADREATITIANARRDENIIRGKADAERNSIFAKAYSKDREFFDFYRALQAYDQSLQGNNTRFILSPGNDFFNYFGNYGKAMPPSPSAPQSVLPPSSLPDDNDQASNNPVSDTQITADDNN